nr:PAS domain S-box protein [Zhaonella formicivorans]
MVIEELSTRTPLDLKPEFDLQSFRELLNPLLGGEQEQVLFNTVHRRKDGSRYPVEINLQLFDYGGEKLCLALVADLTERKQLEEEKRCKEEQCRLMLEGIPSPAWLVSRERRILAQNKAAEMVGTKVGGYCWGSIHGTASLTDEYKISLEKTGSPLPGTRCYFCCGDEALDRNEPINSEVELAGTIWDTWWIPPKPLVGIVCGIWMNVNSYWNYRPWGNPGFPFFQCLKLLLIAKQHSNA